MNTGKFINNFLLDTADTSYMFRIDKYKHLEHVYYGRKMQIEDSEALSLKRNILYGDTIMYNKKDDVYALDTIPQEFGSYGQGDFKEASIEIENGESYTCDFTYESHEIIKGNVEIKDLPSSYGAANTLIVHLKDKVNSLKLDLYYTIYPNENVISRRAVLVNDGKKDYRLHKMMSFCLDLFEDGLLRRLEQGNTHQLKRHQQRNLYQRFPCRFLQCQKQSGLHHQEAQNFRESG